MPATNMTDDVLHGLNIPSQAMVSPEQNISGRESSLRHWGVGEGSQAQLEWRERRRWKRKSPGCALYSFCYKAALCTAGSLPCLPIRRLAFLSSCAGLSPLHRGGGRGTGPSPAAHHLPGHPSALLHCPQHHCLPPAVPGAGFIPVHPQSDSRSEHVQLKGQSGLSSSFSLHFILKMRKLQGLATAGPR